MDYPRNEHRVVRLVHGERRSGKSNERESSKQKTNKFQYGPFRDLQMSGVILVMSFGGQMNSKEQDEFQRVSAVCFFFPKHPMLKRFRGPFPTCTCKCVGQLC